MSLSKCRIAVAGLGTIGSGVAQIIEEHSQKGAPVELVGILERTPEIGYAKPWFEKSPHLFYESPEALFQDKNCDLVVETIGGCGFAKDLILKAFDAGKHVVSANKDLVARHGQELMDTAQKNKCSFLFEAGVGGAIPVLSLLNNYFQTADVDGVLGILNGTTNYILSEMDQADLSFEVALQQAQEKGFAEQDPTNDIKGYDARYKLVILNYLLTGQWFAPEDIVVEGIDHLQLADFEYAKRMNRCIKLVACMQRGSDHIRAFVLPLMLPPDHVLSNVHGSTNIVTVQGKFSDEISLIGQGAGTLPTASAIVSDVYNITRGSGSVAASSSETLPLLPFSEYVFQHTLRFEIKDAPGIVGRIGKVLEKYQVNIYALEQLPQYHGLTEGSKGIEKSAIFTLTLEECQEKAVAQAVQELNNENYLLNPIMVLRGLSRQNIL